MKRTIETLLNKTAALLKPATAGVLLAATMLAVPATTFAEWRGERGRVEVERHRDSDRGYSRDRDGDRDRDRYRRPEVVVRPSYRPGVVFGYGNRGYYTPPPPPCGFYDRWGYWHEDPGCYYGYPR